MGEMKEKEMEGGVKLKEEHKKITELAKGQLKKGDSWFLIDERWYKQWEKYVTNNGFSWDVQTHHKDFYPGPVDNSALYMDNTFEEVKDHMIEESDYELIPTEAWQMLIEKYGSLEGQPPIERKVIEQGMYTKKQIIEIYPVQLKLCNYANQDDCVVKKYSRTMTIDELDKEMRKQFSISSDQETRIWNAFIEDNYDELDKNKTIEDHSLQKNQRVIVEVKKEGVWPHGESKSTKSSTWYNGSSTSQNTSSSSGMFSSSPSSSSYQLRNTSQSYGKKKVTAGLCGLNNLGNTCFMNSALQCLSNVPALTNYFKNNEYKSELNLHNPLGMGGKIAKQYANLIQMIWSGENTSYAPREFKYAVGQFQSRFLGYQQQDSQELLAFLIDGLHEDLNRISKKPYIEAKDADGRPDDVVAAEAWENHRKRNDSIIVDTLHGLYRSIVDCPECPRISVTFDPFCFLTLPLPVKKDRTVECTFVPLDHTQSMMKYKVTVPKSGTIKDICKSLSQYNSVPFENMTVTDIYNSRFHKVFQSTEQIRNIYDKDFIYVFESPPDTTMLPVYMRYVSPTGSCHLFGQPVLVPVQLTNTTYRQLYKAILKAAFRYLENDNLRLEIVELLKHDSGDEKMDVKENCQKEEDENGFEGISSLFDIRVVNSFGTQDYKVFEDCGETALKLTETLHLSANWSETACDNYFTKNWLEIVETHESAMPGAMKKAAAGLNLMTCMELFTSKEQLEKENTWYCSDCKKHQQATKKFDLWMLPPVLIFHLKRFSNTRWSRDKLDTFIDFPINDLDLSDFIVNPHKDKVPENKRKYNLIAVTNHYGGLGGGHYTAFAKNYLDKQWHYFDDSSVSLSSEDRVVTKAAYLLVYQRQDMEGWIEENTGKPFPYMQPIFSPRAMDQEAGVNGSPFHFNSSNDEDIINNNNAEDEMDVS